MASRIPVASPFSNSAHPFSIIIGSGPTPRIIAIKPWLAVAGGVIASLLLGWYLVATLYLVFRDEMLARLVGQQTEMQYAYEDRLAALRNQIDKVTSRQLLDQNTIEGKLHELLSRQAQLETRQAVVASLAEQPLFAQQKAQPPRAARMIDPALAGAVRAFASPEPKPSAADAFELRLFQPREPSAVGGPEADLDRKPTDNKPSHGKPSDRTSLNDAPAALAIAAARDAADRLERRQIAALEALDHHARGNAQRLSVVFAETGLDQGRFAALAKPAAQGGPLVAIGASAKGQGPFEQKLAQVQSALLQGERLRRIVGTLPVTRPMPMDYETTSGYGARSDPFTRGMAMHTGIDFRAPSGAIVRATAPGKVVEADYVGGYGNMVEVDHGNGLSTRYAHLSAIGVDVGATVAKGDALGRVGSTGRSTGPHLHYETRIDGEPTDPMRFIRAGHKLGAP